MLNCLSWHLDEIILKFCEKQTIGHHIFFFFYGATIAVYSACLACSHRVEQGMHLYSICLACSHFVERGMQLLSGCLACMKPWAQFPAPHKLDMVMMKQARHSAGEGRRTRSPRSPSGYRELKDSLDQTRPYFQNQKQK